MTHALRNVRSPLAAMTMGIVMTVGVGGAGDGRARGDVMFSNFDENTVWFAAWYFIGDQPMAEYEGAIRFEPTVSFDVDALELPVVSLGEEGFYSPPPPSGTVFGDSMRVAIYADDGTGTPGELLEIVDVLDALPPWKGMGPMPEPMTVAFAGTTRLNAGQVYWISTLEAEGSVVGWFGANANMNEWQRRARFVDGRTWSVPQLRRLGLRVHGTPVPKCEGDTNSDGEVDVDDLVAVILGWGPCPKQPQACPANVANTGASANQVDVDDLIAVILGWGTCG